MVERRKMTRWDWALVVLLTAEALVLGACAGAVLGAFSRPWDCLGAEEACYVAEPEVDDGR